MSRPLLVNVTVPANRWPTLLGVVAVVCLCCAPLFVGLSSRDLDNDEAIYSYAVDRILDTGDWLTPRLIPNDGPFLEKPPLKFWLVAAAVKTGLLPRNEFGFRFLDSLFAAVAFIYVLQLASRVGGVLAGISAVLVLFTLERLIFEHGLRSNTMEAALVLSYCGGIYHFARSVEETKRHRSRALATTAFFVLGFMTKFVAAVFLPAVCIAGLLTRTEASNQSGERRRDWILASVLAGAAIAPWFVYQSLRVGTVLWKEMFGVHVMQRFTIGLDPAHLLPWNFYLSQLWTEFSVTGTHWLVLVGLAILVLRARHEWLPRLLLAWCIVPIAAMSLGRSKVFHYIYPSLPPLAIAAGVGVAQIVGSVNQLTRLTWPRAFPRTQMYRDALLWVAVAAASLALWTARIGPVRWTLAGTLVFRNSSVWRPLMIAVAVLSVGGYRGRVSPAMRVVVTVIVFASLLPFVAYRNILGRLDVAAYPLRALRDCSVSADARPRQTRVYLRYDDLRSHSFYYYLRGIGSWTVDLPIDTNEVRQHLPPEDESILVLPREDYRRFSRNLVEMGGVTTEGDPPNITSVALPASSHVVLLLPRALQRCGGAMNAAADGVQTRILKGVD